MNVPDHMKIIDAALKEVREFDWFDLAVRITKAKERK